MSKYVCERDETSPTGWSYAGAPYTPGGSCDWHQPGECPACDTENSKDAAQDA